MRNSNIYLFILITLFFKISGHSQSSHLLWYDEPAQYFEESLVLGNGKMGASVFGGISSDKIYLNDATFWSGEPVQTMMSPKAYKNIPEIREALNNEDYELANEVYKKVQGSFSQSYAPIGTMFVNFKHSKNAQNYRRSLDLSNATATTKYSVGNSDYEREYFVSNPDKVMVMHYTSSEDSSLNFKIEFKSEMKYQISNDSKTLVINGYAPYHAEPIYNDVPDPVLFDETRGTRFTVRIQITETDGTVKISKNVLSLSKGSKATVLMSIETSFNGFDKNPATEGKDNASLAASQLQQASNKNYEVLKNAHIADYQSFFNRLSLTLGETMAPDITTDERLIRYAGGAEDKNLEVLYFQFGRYLLISSSRTKEVPANLQGIWNQHVRPPWSSNYTININTQENYWLAESGNLSEMHMPLMGFIKNLAQTGAITAKTFYGVNGWTASHNTDIWAMTNPVGGFGKGDPVWANWNMAGAWLSTHLWEHYIYTMDEEFLREKGYPLMKDAAKFCLEWMVQDKDGYYITSPSTSPENLFKKPDGYIGATFYGATSDLAIIKELFDQTIKATEVLDVDPEFKERLNSVRAKLYPYKIGKDGSLQEWYYDWEDADPKHRHQSHLIGLHPGHHINPQKTPELARAVEKALEIKGDDTTGWSKGWRINLWTRLWNGNRAYKMYRELLKPVKPSGLTFKYDGGGGTYPNLLDAHPPFQIDGNFGGAAAVIEMLIQSGEQEIRLLPALPDEWDHGTVKGIRARGGYEIDMEWANNRPINLTIRSQEENTVKLIFGATEKEFHLNKGTNSVLFFFF
tara:strand:- start:4893 stop:7298 length:2406 start_codon:yes stop_codon:yes gene_type:complete